jgi:hypothetical protein
MPRRLLILFLGLLFPCTQPGRADFISQVLEDNPYGFWILNDAPANPTKADDSSINGFDGTYGAIPQGIAGPSWVPGSGLVANCVFGPTLNFGIYFGGPVNLGANGFTIEAWINPTLAGLQKPRRIAGSGGRITVGRNGYGFGTAAGGGLVFSSLGVQDYFTTTVKLQPDQWYYVGVVLDASNDANFYVNGSLVESVPGTQPTIAPTLPFYIGVEFSPAPPDEIFVGGMAGVSVYDAPLTPAQIQAQYNAGIVPEPSSIALIGAALGLGCTFWRDRRRVRRDAA